MPTGLPCESLGLTQAKEERGGYTSLQYRRTSLSKNRTPSASPCFAFKDAIGRVAVGGVCPAHIVAEKKLPIAVNCDDPGPTSLMTSTGAGGAGFAGCWAPAISNELDNNASRKCRLRMPGNLTGGLPTQAVSQLPAPWLRG